MRTLIIAEAGINHNRDINLAFKLIDAAKDSGADVVKFQAALPEEVVTTKGEMAEYQVNNMRKSETQLEMTKRIHLDLDEYIKLEKYCAFKNIKFACTSFGPSATKALSKLKMPFWKIPSGEITNLPYLRHIASFKKPIIISTGMANMGEIEAAINIIEKNGINKEQVTVLHCTTDYPASFNEVNLKAMANISNSFNVKVGYSDHTTGIEIPIAAVALGAKVIEKHLTIDKTLVGPDHQASIEPKDFSNMVNSIRNIEIALGDGIKKPTAKETKNIKIVRRSIVAATKILKGEKFTEENLTVKRPFTGRSPMEWDSIIGEIASRDYIKDDNID